MDEIVEDTTPFEFQVFNKIFLEEGAIEEFKESLEPWMVGSIHGDQGFGEFYQALLDFYKDTSIDPVDPIAFKSWLETETEIYDVLGGSGGVDFFIKSITNIETTDTNSIVKVIRHRARKRQQLNLTLKLQALLEKKGHKTEEEVEQIQQFADRIRDLEGSLNYDPLSSVTTATEIASRAGDLMTVPDFLPTPFPEYNKALGYTESAGYFRGACHAVVAMSGRGKPLDVETPILMGNGEYKRLGDIEIGDLVITGEGRPRRVLNVFEQGKLPSLRITTRSSRTVNSALDHPFMTRLGWKEAKDLSVGDYLAIPRSVTLTGEIEGHPLESNLDDLLDETMYDNVDYRYFGDEIVSIEVIEDKECRCIEVEEDHTFLANGFVVHNSTFVKNLCNHWADQGYGVLFINYEEAQAHWERVLMTQIIGENVYRYADVWTAEEKQERLEIFRNRLESWGDNMMVRHDPDSSYFEDLELWLRDIIGHAETRPDVVVIDTIQSMVTKSSGPRWGEFEAMMIKLERIARDMDAVFVLTVQQNAEQMKEKREIVQQTDVGGGATITQKSSVVTFLVDGGSGDGEDGIMELQITKNRITGVSDSNSPPIVRYNDATKSYENYIIPESERYEVVSSIANDVFGDFNT